MPRFEKELEERGVCTEGVITKSENRPFEHDNEWTVFALEYQFSIGEKIYQESLGEFAICTAHVDWASVGGLLGWEKIHFNSEDVFRVLKEGTKIQVIYLPDTPDRNTPVFDEIIYVASQIE